LFLATRALVRTVLSKYAGIPSADWRFRTDPQDKPFVLAPVVDPPLWFNLANTYGLIVCAVSTIHSTLGVDAERIDRNVEAADIAKQNFSDKEQRALLTLPPSEAGEALLRLLDTEGELRQGPRHGLIGSAPVVFL